MRSWYEMVAVRLASYQIVAALGYPGKRSVPRCCHMISASFRPQSDMRKLAALGFVYCARVTHPQRQAHSDGQDERSIDAGGQLASFVQTHIVWLCVWLLGTPKSKQHNANCRNTVINTNQSQLCLDKLYTVVAAHTV